MYHSDRFSGDKRQMIPGGVLKCESVPSELLFNVCVDSILQSSLGESIEFQNNIHFFPK